MRAALFSFGRIAAPATRRHIRADAGFRRARLVQDHFSSRAAGSNALLRRPSNRVSLDFDGAFDLFCPPKNGIGAATARSTCRGTSFDASHGVSALRAGSIVQIPVELFCVPIHASCRFGRLKNKHATRRQFALRALGPLGYRVRAWLDGVEPAEATMRNGHWLGAAESLLANRSAGRRNG